MNCKQIYIKDKQIKYYWKNTHKVEENGGELLWKQNYLDTYKTCT